MNHQFSNSFLLLALMLPSASLQATLVAGAITGLQCPHDHYLLTRSGVPTNLPVQIFIEVREGDSIAIHANQPALYYRDEQLTLQTVTYQQLPFTRVRTQLSPHSLYGQTSGPTLAIFAKCTSSQRCD